MLCSRPEIKVIAAIESKHNAAKLLRQIDRPHSRSAVARAQPKATSLP
jgi:hypothetical protein